MANLLEPPDETRSLELVARLREGDSRAWDELYRRYHDQLLLCARLRLGKRLRAHLESEDIFQSVARDAIGALRTFEYRGPGSLMRFLRSLMTNKIRDRADTFGAAKRAGAVPLDSAWIESLEARSEPRYYDEASFERLERALRSLPADLREILELRKLEGLSSKEVAGRLGKSDEAVRAATSRAMARLALAMDERGS